MRIGLYTVTALPKLGGQEAVVDALARQFLKMGHEVTVLAPLPKRSIKLNDSAYPYRVIRHPRFISTKHFVSWYRRFLTNTARAHRFDVLHCHDVYPSGYLAALTRPVLNIPIIITSHGGDVREGNVRIVKRGMQQRFEQAVKTADALVSIGQFTTDGFIRLGGDRSKIYDIPNGVDLEPFSRRVRRPVALDTSIVEGNYVFFIGRIAKRKGLDLLIQAAKQLPDRPDAALVIAGTGDDEAEVDHQIAKANLQRRVKRVGRVGGDLKTFLLQNARAVVMPSRGWEAFPLVVLESYAAGTPVIGTDIPGLQDLIRNEESGLLVQPESPDDLAKAISRVFSDEVWVQHARQAAQLSAAGFDWKSIAQRHIELYEKLIAHSGTTFRSV